MPEASLRQQSDVILSTLVKMQKQTRLVHDWFSRQKISVNAQMFAEVKVGYQSNQNKGCF